MLTPSELTVNLSPVPVVVVTVSPNPAYPTPTLAVRVDPLKPKETPLEFEKTRFERSLEEFEAETLILEIAWWSNRVWNMASAFSQSCAIRLLTSSTPVIGFQSSL